MDKKEQGDSREQKVAKIKKDPNVSADTIARIVSDMLKHERKQHYTKKIRESYWSKVADRKQKVVRDPKTGKAKVVSSRDDIKVESTEELDEMNRPVRRGGKTPHRFGTGVIKHSRPKLAGAGNNRSGDPVARASKQVQIAQQKVRLAQMQRNLHNNFEQDDDNLIDEGEKLTDKAKATIRYALGHPRKKAPYSSAKAAVELARMARNKNYETKNKKVDEQQDLAEIRREKNSEYKKDRVAFANARKQRFKYRKQRDVDNGIEYPHDSKVKGAKVDHSIKSDPNKRHYYMDEQNVNEGLTTIKNILTGKRRATMKKLQSRIDAHKHDSGLRATKEYDPFKTHSNSPIGQVSRGYQDMQVDIQKGSRDAKTRKTAGHRQFALRWSRRMADKKFPQFKENLDVITNNIRYLAEQGFVFGLGLNESHLEDLSPQSLDLIHRSFTHSLDKMADMGLQGNHNFNEKLFVEAVAVYSDLSDLMDSLDNDAQLAESNVGKVADFISLEEAKRGRKPKNPKVDTEVADDADQHIIMQMRKAVSLRGQHQVTFANGEKHLMPSVDAQRALHLYANARGVDAKDNLTNTIRKSKADFYRVVRDK